MLQASTRIYRSNKHLCLAAVQAIQSAIGYNLQGFPVTQTEDCREFLQLHDVDGFLELPVSQEISSDQSSSCIPAILPTAEYKMLEEVCCGEHADQGMVDLAMESCSWAVFRGTSYLERRTCCVTRHAGT